MQILLNCRWRVDFSAGDNQEKNKKQQARRSDKHPFKFIGFNDNLPEVLFIARTEILLLMLNELFLMIYGAIDYHVIKIVIAVCIGSVRILKADQYFIFRCIV